MNGEREPGFVCSRKFGEVFRDGFFGYVIVTVIYGLEVAFDGVFDMLLYVGAFVDGEVYRGDDRVVVPDPPYAVVVFCRGVFWEHNGNDGNGNEEYEASQQRFPVDVESGVHGWLFVTHGALYAVDFLYFVAEIADDFRVLDKDFHAGGENAFIGVDV